VIKRKYLSRQRKKQNTKEHRQSQNHSCEELWLGNMDWGRLEEAVRREHGAADETHWIHIA